MADAVWQDYNFSTGTCCFFNSRLHLLLHVGPEQSRSKWVSIRYHSLIDLDYEHQLTFHSKR